MGELEALIAKLTAAESEMRERLEIAEVRRKDIDRDLALRELEANTRARDGTRLEKQVEQDNAFSSLGLANAQRHTDAFIELAKSTIESNIRNVEFNARIAEHLGRIADALGAK